MGGMKLRRAVGAALAMLFVWAAQPPVASASIIVYTLLAVPLTATADQVTSFNMTLTNVAGPDELGCVEVMLPAEYEIYSVSDPVASNGRDWSSSSDGNTVIVHANGGGGRLKLLQSATFTIVARPKEAGMTSWSNHAHRSHNCDDSEAIGIPVEVVVLIPVIPTPTPTPVPTPTLTPHPTAKPTPVPTPVPTPRPVVTPRPPPPTPAPVVTVVPTPEPDPSPSSQPTETPSPTPSATPSPEAVPPAATPPDDSGTGAVQMVLTPEQEETGLLALAAASVLAGASVFAVPAAVLGGPGLLIILFVVLQAVGALGWIPAVRRLRSEDSQRA